MYNLLENGMVIASEPTFIEPDIFATCECCGQPIFKANDYLDGDEYVELVPDEFIHVECVMDWVRRNKQEAK